MTSAREDGPADTRLRAAVEANVAWCDLVCRAHGIPTFERDGVWAATARSPRFYPDAITLQPDVVDVLASTEAGPGRSVKDSFASLDLDGDGFDVLFEARWISRAPAPARATAWAELALGRWLAAAGAPDSIRPAAVASEDVRVLGIVRGDEVAAGAILNRAGGAVGVSNVFAVDAAEVWATLPAAAAAAFGPLPLVGYEYGDDLVPALAAGFTDLGPLRVWIERS